MPSPVPITPKSLDDYRTHVGDDAIAEILELARPLRGARVLHLNSTAFGGGVAELLNSIVPLLQDLGIEAEWQVLDATPDFFNVTKSMHNAVQGMYIPWNNTMADTWREVNRANADAITERYDFVYVHDPQPAGLLYYVRLRESEPLGAKWIWRCHLDTTDALPEVWDFLRGYVQLYDGIVFTMKEYVRSMHGPQLAIIPPAIDPTSTKNTPLPRSVVREVLERYEVDPDRPILAQISRFDPWKDPLGVIDTYRILKEQRPQLQLLMVASMANDDPEAWSFYERIVRKAGEDYDIHVLTNLNGVGNLEVNTFQSAADVVMQKSLREGFGLVISEALWKGKAFVGSSAGGIPMQLDNGRVGRIANTTQEFADSIGELLDDAEARRSLGEAAKEHVRENYLTTRLLADHLRLMNRISSNGAQPKRRTRTKRARGS